MSHNIIIVFSAMKTYTSHWLYLEWHTINGIKIVLDTVFENVSVH